MMLSNRLKESSVWTLDEGQWAVNNTQTVVPAQGFAPADTEKCEAPPSSFLLDTQRDRTNDCWLPHHNASPQGQLAAQRSILLQQNNLVPWRLCAVWTCPSGEDYFIDAFQRWGWIPSFLPPCDCVTHELPCVCRQRHVDGLLCGIPNYPIHQGWRFWNDDERTAACRVGLSALCCMLSPTRDHSVCATVWRYATRDLRWLRHGIIIHSGDYYCCCCCCRCCCLACRLCLIFIFVVAVLIQTFLSCNFIHSKTNHELRRPVPTIQQQHVFQRRKLAPTHARPFGPGSP